MEHCTHLHRLSDGRVLEYATFGDPHGQPLLYFHGFLGSCHQAALADASARHLHLRIIAPNRPGIGRSTLHTFSSIHDSVSDYASLLDSLHIDRVVCMGVSSGSCFALAFTERFSERVLLTGVAGCIGPFNVLRNLETMQWFRRLFLLGCKDYPRVVGVLLRVTYVVCRYRPQWLYEWLVQTSCLLEPTLQRNRDMIETMLWSDYQDVFLQEHGVQGLLQEARLFFRWGFQLKDIPVTQRVLFWHGRHDTLFPWSVARDVARSIPSAKVELCSGGHMTFLTKIDAILERLCQNLSENQDRHFADQKDKKSHHHSGFLLPRFT